MAVATRELDMLYQSTLEKILPGLQNAVFSPTAFLDYAQSRITNIRSGERIRTEVEKDKNTTFGYYNNYGTLNTGTMAGVRSAYYDWVQWSINIAINGKEETVNRGEHQIFSLFTQKVENAVNTAKDVLDLDLLQAAGGVDGSGNNLFNGLYTLVGDRSSTVKIVGGIDCSDAADGQTWWESLIYRPNDGNNPGTQVNSNTGQVLTIGMIDKMIDTLDERGKKPTRAFTNKATQRAFISVLAQENQPIMMNQELTLRTGFDNVVYRGVTFMTSRNMKTYSMTGSTEKSSDIFFLNDDDIEMAIVPDRWFSKTEFIRPYNQDARYAHILGMGQFIVTNRRYLGKIENVARQA